MFGGLKNKIKFGIIITLVIINHFMFKTLIPLELPVYSLFKEPTSIEDISNPFATLIIPKIKVKEQLYPLNDPLNQVELHPEIIIFNNPAKKTGPILIAAHSGNTKVSFFKRLDHLLIGDIVHLEYQDIQYTYQVYLTEEQAKKGFIRINEEGIVLILTTCHPHKETKQLVVYAKMQ